MAASTSAAKPILPAGPIVQKAVHSLLREFLCLTLLPRHTFYKNNLFLLQCACGFHCGDKFTEFFHRRPLLCSASGIMAATRL